MYLDNGYNTYLDIDIILYTMRKLIRHDAASKWPHRIEQNRIEQNRIEQNRIEKQNSFFLLFKHGKFYQEYKNY